MQAILQSLLKPLIRLFDLFIALLGGPSMAKFLVRRILAAIPVLFTVILLTFVLIRAMPGGPFDNNGTKQMAPAVKTALLNRYGFDKPFFLNLPNDGVTPDFGMEMRQIYAAGPMCEALQAGKSIKEATPEQPVYTYEGWALVRIVDEFRETTIDYADPAKSEAPKVTRCIERRSVLYSDLTRSQFFGYLNNMLRLDFGPSIGLNNRNSNVQVSDVINRGLPVSAQLGFYALIIGYVIGIPLGVLAAIRANSAIDLAITTGIGIFNSLPTLVMGPILLLIFTAYFKILPSPDPRVWRGGNLLDGEYLSRAILPMMVLGLGIAGGLARLTRASALQILRDDYIRTARAKGLRERTVIYIHALKNALIPVVTISGPLLAGILTGTLVLERVFAIPGIGNVFFNSITNRDYTLLLGVTVVFSIFLIIGNVLVDVMYTWLDPRIRFD